MLTTDDFDASTVDPRSVKFAHASPVRWALEDVDGDGDVDLLFHFKMQDLSLTNDSTTATLTGETLDGVQIEGTDTVNIVPKGKYSLSPALPRWAAPDSYLHAPC